MANTLTKVTTFYGRGREFYILYDPEGRNICGEQKHYWGIESNLFGEDGHLTREINGCDGHLSATVADCVESVRQTIEIDYLIETTGMDAREACIAYVKKKMGIA